MYFNQQMGAPHAVCWSKSCFWHLFPSLKQLFSSFSIIKRFIIFIEGKRRIFFYCGTFLYIYTFDFYVCSKSFIYLPFWKNCFTVKNMISTSKQHAEHPFAGRNTQHKEHFMKKVKVKNLSWFCQFLYFLLLWDQTQKTTNETAMKYELGSTEMFITFFNNIIY